MDIFTYDDYRTFVVDWVKSQPKKGHGLYRQIAHHLRLAPVTVSQIFKGDRNLPMESAIPLATFLGLGHLQKRYFMKLVQLSHAGDNTLREFLIEEAQRLKQDSTLLKNRVRSDVKLNAAELAQFHSSWIYSGVRLLTSISSYRETSAIADRLNLPTEKVEEVLEFLISCGLVITQGNKLAMGPTRTHLPNDSPYVQARQSSWRLKASERMHHMKRDELFYTAPMSISVADIPRIKRELLALIESVNAIVEKSEPQELACLNMDWFRV